MNPQIFRSLRLSSVAHRNSSPTALTAVAALIRRRNGGVWDETVDRSEVAEVSNRIRHVSRPWFVADWRQDVGSGQRPYQSSICTSSTITQLLVNSRESHRRLWTMATAVQLQWQLGNDTARPPPACRLT